MVNINLRFATSLIIFAGSIALSFYTRLGWWAFAGTLLYASFQIDRDTDAEIAFSYATLVFAVLVYLVAFIRMEWSF